MPLCKLLQFKSRKDLWRKESGAERVQDLGKLSIDRAMVQARWLFKVSPILTCVFADNECVYALDNSSGVIREYYRPIIINEKVVKLSQEVCFAAEVCFYSTFSRPKWLESIRVIDGETPMVICDGNLGESFKITLEEVMKLDRYKKLAKPLDDLIELLGDELRAIGSLSIIDWQGTNSPYIDRKCLWCTRKKIGKEAWEWSDYDCILHKWLF